MGFPTWVHVSLLQIPYQSHLDVYYETHTISHTIEKKWVTYYYTVSHFSYAPLFQGPHFLTKMLELNIRYDNLFIDILAV